MTVKQGPGPGDRPHPSRIRPGQLFFPLAGRTRLRISVKRLDEEWVRVVREDGSEASVALDRLLAVDSQGNGRHYRFHGWKHRPRGYQTELRVLAVSPRSTTCMIGLPEWRVDAKFEQPHSLLPESLRTAGASGICMANLASASVAGLGIHSCRKGKIRDASRERSGRHPDVLAEGQQFRRRSDGASIRLLDVVNDDETIPAWNGRRVIRITRRRLLDVGPDGQGRYYEYIGGGITATRRRRASAGGRRGSSK